MGGPRGRLDDSEERGQGEVEAVFSRHRLNVIDGEHDAFDGERVETLGPV